jgi:hypothetical protein
MRKLYIAYTEEVGEVEGIFDQDGTMLDFWSCNDATWRNEYFSPFMERLGFDVDVAPDWMVKKLEEAARELWG